LVYAVVIGRHRMLGVQLEELRALGVAEMIQVPKIDEDAIEGLVAEWAERGVRYVVIQALPLRLLDKLYKASRRVGIDLLVAHMETVAMARTREEAERLVAEKPEARTFVSAPGDEYLRVIEHKGWMRIRRLEVELEPALGG